jgi:hypothetical protein
MNELNSYLEALENRVTRLEQEKQQIKGSINDVSNAFYQSDRGTDLETKSGLQSPNFLKRAFTVWGHYFVAQLIIGLILGIGYVVIVLGVIEYLGKH